MEKFDLENFPTSNSAKKMLEAVSDGFYDESYVGKWIYQVMGQEYDTAQEIVESLPYQFFPETATWGLMYHEIKWGLPVRLNLSYEERRRLIYQKRDNKAPMTPYRMETYLKNVTGFEVRIADVNDPGDFGFIAPHPNVFKAYFMGEGTLDSKKVHKELDRLKQSHTTYKVNDRTEIELDCRELEKIVLQKIIFHAQLLFWDCYVFNGEWNLDGSVGLDAHRRYNLVLGFKYPMGEIINENNVRLASVRFLSKVNNKELIGARVNYHFGISFWNTRLFDGSWLADGSVVMNEYRRYGLGLGIVYKLQGLHESEVMRSRLILSCKQHTTEEIAARAENRFSIDFWRTLYLDGEVLLNGREFLNNSRLRMKAAVKHRFAVASLQTEQINATVVTKTRDFWFLDGALSLNGTRSLNSIYRKETIE